MRPCELTLTKHVVIKNGNIFKQKTNKKQKQNKKLSFLYTRFYLFQVYTTALSLTTKSHFLAHTTHFAL